MTLYIASDETPKVFGDIIKAIEEARKGPYVPQYPSESYSNAIICYVCLKKMAALDDASFVCMCKHDDGDGTPFRGVCNTCWKEGLYADLTGDRRKEMFKSVPEGHNLKITNVGQKLKTERETDVRSRSERSEMLQFLLIVLLTPVFLIVFQDIVASEPFDASFTTRVFDAYASIFCAFSDILRSIVTIEEEWWYCRRCSST